MTTPAPPTHSSPYVSQAAYAAGHEVSRQAVTKWRQRGWLVMESDQVDVEASNEFLRMYRKSGVSRGSDVQLIKPIALPGESHEDTAERLVREIAPMTMAEAQRVKQVYLAKLAQLDYDRKVALFVEADQVAALVGAEYDQVRTRILAIAREGAPRAFRCKTPAEVQDVLSHLVISALEELTAE